MKEIKIYKKGKKERKHKKERSRTYVSLVLSDWIRHVVSMNFFLLVHNFPLNKSAKLHQNRSKIFGKKKQEERKLNR
jgi:hypothetical protein